MAVNVGPSEEYPGMFPLLQIDDLDEKILSYLSPGDLARAKVVMVARWL